MERGYPQNFIDKTLVPFITQYHPAVSNLKEILTMKCYLITATTHGNNHFLSKLEPLITSYRKAHSLIDILVIAKI